ncbi:MAG: hypothetical protein KBH11_11505 [Bacteroidia bacterium]|nr:hypothetical protein [Bacteroidia bacterium]
MKKLCFLGLILFGIPFYCLSQQIIPNNGLIKNPKELKRLEQKKENLQQNLDNIITVSKSLNINRNATDSATLVVAAENLVDTIQSISNEIEKVDSTITLLKDETATIIFSGASSLNSSEELKSFSGSNRVLAFIQLTRILDVSITYNLAAVKPQSIARDSIDLISLMFPEAGTTGFTFGSRIKIVTGNKQKSKATTHNLSGTGEFSFKQTKFNNTLTDSTGNLVDGGTKEFSALNFNFGFKYLYTYEPPNQPETPLTFGIATYMNIFNIPNEDEESFQLIFQDSFKKRSLITSVGAKISLQYRGYVLFGDFRQNIDTKNFKNENRFKGFVYNIGTLINTDLLRF